MESSYSTTTTTQTTTSTTATTKTKENDSTQKTTLFQELKTEKKDPKDITYDEYKKLTRENIDQLYPKDKMLEQNKEALSLHIKANMTDDEVLNKVLFEKELESLNTLDKEDKKHIKSANEVMNRMFDFITGIARQSMMMEAMTQHLSSFAHAQDMDAQTYAFEFTKTVAVTVGNVTRSVSYTQSTQFTNKTGISTSMLFSAYDTMSSTYKKVTDDHQYGKDSYFYKGTRAVMSYHDGIKDEYNKRMEDQHTLLYSYTKVTMTKQSEDTAKKEENPKSTNDILSSMVNRYKDNLANIKTAGELPEDAMEQMKRSYKESFTDEKYEELLKKLDIQGMSDSDKKLMKSIIADRYISDDEIQGLSYEQVKLLDKFKMQKDENGNYIEETMISMDYKASRLMHTTFISKDDDFNKAIFGKIKDMEDNDNISIYMALISESWNFPPVESQFQNEYNPAEKLTKMIRDNELYLKSAVQIHEIEYHMNLKNLYSDVLHRYDEISDKDVKDKPEAASLLVDIDQVLLDDLMELIKSGVTKSEIENLEKLIEDLNRLIDDSDKKKVSLDKLETMIQELKDEITRLQKRFGGKEEVKTDEKLQTEDSEHLTEVMKKFKSIVLSLEKVLDDIKEQARENARAHSTQEELAMREKMKNKQ